MLAYFIGAVLLVIIDFTIFGYKPHLGFIIHNVGALVIGFIFVYYPYQFIKEKEGNKYVHFFIILMGVIMLAVHVTKLVVGKCW